METIFSMQVILYLGNPEVPRKDSQCELRLAFRSLLPPVQWSFYPSKMTKEHPILLWEWHQWPHHRPSKQCYNTGFKIKGKAGREYAFFQICIERWLPFVPQSYVSWFGHRLALGSWTSHMTWFLKSSLVLHSGSSMERKGISSRVLQVAGFNFILWHPHGECWPLPAAAHLGSETSFLEKPWIWKG